jgi:branched-chain amino acid transport system ATP-binding protein
MSPVPLQVFGVSVRFDGVLAVDDVSLEVGRGEILGLVGPNGAGKTTLINAMSGMVRPTAGQVVMDGVDITRMPAHRRARTGMRRTFQFSGLVNDETVLTDLLIAQHAHWEGDAVERAHALLAEVGVDHLAGEVVGELPTGLARLVEVACAMAGDPRVLLLDEPSSGLTSDETDRLSRVLSEHERRAGCAMLVVAHDMRFVMGLAQRVVVLAQGRVIAEGTPAEVQADEQVRSLYLGAMA